MSLTAAVLQAKRDIHEYFRNPGEVNTREVVVEDAYLERDPVVIEDEPDVRVEVTPAPAETVLPVAPAALDTSEPALDAVPDAPRTWFGRIGRRVAGWFS
jgi:hypothetical protein